MNRARVALGATFVATVLTAGTALAQSPPEMRTVLAGKKFTPPIRGEALIEHTRPVTKREGANVVTKVIVRNASLAPVPLLTFSETWFDKGGALVIGNRASIKGLMQPGEIQTMTITTPYRSTMSSNNFNFSHANGNVKPQRVDKLDDPNAAAAPTTAAKK